MHLCAPRLSATPGPASTPAVTLKADGWPTARPTPLLRHHRDSHSRPTPLAPWAAGHPWTARVVHFGNFGPPLWPHWCCGKLRRAFGGSFMRPLPPGLMGSHPRSTLTRPVATLGSRALLWPRILSRRPPGVPFGVRLLPPLLGSAQLRAPHPACLRHHRLFRRLLDRQPGLG